MSQDFLEHAREIGQNTQRTQIVSSLQLPIITLSDGRQIINLLTKDYLGLANHPLLVKTATDAFEEMHFGLSTSVFLRNTQTVCRELEINLSRFLGTEESMFIFSCFDIQNELYKNFLDTDDAIICDASNQKPAHYKFQNIADLEQILRQTKYHRYRLIIVEGISSLDGRMTNLPVMCELAKKHHALLIVDDSHGAGFIGPTGKGTHEYHRSMNQVDLLIHSFGQTAGSYISGRKALIDWLRQRIQPSTMTKSIAIATMLGVLELLFRSEERVQHLHQNALYLRKALHALRFTVLPGHHPIISIIIKTPELAQQIVESLFREGVHAEALSSPQLPKNQARIRMQISASHQKWHLDKAIDAFMIVGKKLGVI